MLDGKGLEGQVQKGERLRTADWSHINSHRGVKSSRGDTVNDAVVTLHGSEGC